MTTLRFKTMFLNRVFKNLNILHKRVRALQESGYIKKTGARKSKVGFDYVTEMNDIKTFRKPKRYVG